MLTDKQIQAREKLESLLKEEKAKYEALYEAETQWIRDLLENLPKNGINASVSSADSNLSKKQKLKKDEKKDTFMTKVAQILQEANEPLTVTEMIPKMNKISAKQYDYAKFSGTLSAQYKSKRSPINQEKISDFPISYRYLYALKDWYDEAGKLKDEFYLKILKRR